MKGLRLYVRTTDESDAAALDRLLGRGTLPSSTNIDFVGKLIGDAVAFARTSQRGDTLLIEQVFVTPLLRHKRIGTVLLSEVGAWAASAGLRRLEASGSGMPEEFLLHVGFQSEENSFFKMI